MTMRNAKSNFFAAHYDWLVAGVGLLALLGAAAYFMLAIGADPDAEAAVAARAVDAKKPATTGVKDVDMSDFGLATKLTRNPSTIAEVSDKLESFLACERRVLCKCGRAIPADVKKFPKCPYCGEAQEEEKKVVLDADGDGMPDEWEKRFKLNPNNPADAQQDGDGDGFTNLEEFTAKTDPTDKLDHPDYLDSLKLVLPLKETRMPFVFIAANKIPRGWRCEFFDASMKNDYGRLGRITTAVVGEDVGKYGFTLKDYVKKEAKRAIKGGQGMLKTVDVSEVTLVRKRDGKIIKLVLDEKKAKPAPVDVQATLRYERGNAQNFDVTPGVEITLNGVKFKVVDIKAKGKGAQVTLENSVSGKQKIIESLE